jgi:hypothetical protein
MLIALIVSLIILAFALGVSVPANHDVKFFR